MRALDIRVHWGDRLWCAETRPLADYSAGHQVVGARPELVVPPCVLDAPKRRLIAVSRGVARLLPPGGAARRLRLDVPETLLLGPLRVEVTLVALAPRRWSWPAPPVGMLASLVLHALAVALIAQWMPPLGDGIDEDAPADQRYLLQIRMSEDAEAEPEPQRHPATVDDQPGVGTRDGAPRRLGTAESSRSRVRYGVAGPADNPDPHIARQEALQSNWSWPRIGLTGESDGGARHAPIAPWGRHDALGNDEVSGKGALWGEHIGDARGASGLSGAGGIWLRHT